VHTNYAQTLTRTHTHAYARSLYICICRYDNPFFARATPIPGLVFFYCPENRAENAAHFTIPLMDLAGKEARDVHFLAATN